MSASRPANEKALSNLRLPKREFAQVLRVRINADRPLDPRHSAADWQKHLQVTSWLANHADRTIKISIPLPRLSDIGASDFHGFGSIVSLDISDSVQKVVFGFTTETGRMMVKGIRGAQAEAAALYGNAPVPSSSIDAFQSTIPESETPADTDNIAVATRKMYEFFALADDITHLQCEPRISSTCHRR